MQLKISTLALGIFLGFSGVSFAEEKIGPYQEGLKKDAEAIAKMKRTSPEDAQRRLKLQAAASDQLVVPLKEEFKDRLVGIYIEHTPVDRLVVRLKGDTPVPDRHLNVDGDTLVTTFIHGHSHTKAELRETLAKNWQALQTAIQGLHGSYTDERTGEVVLMVDGKNNKALNEETLHTIAAGILDIPFRIKQTARVAIHKGKRVSAL